MRTKQILSMSAFLLSSLLMSCDSLVEERCLNGCGFDEEGNCTVPTEEGQTCAEDVDAVTCESNADCDGETPVCDTAANEGKGECVTCLADADCGAAAPRCNEEAKTCVECLQASEEADCDGNLCGENSECTEIALNQTEPCRTCEFDRQCAGEGARCLELEFQGSTDGKFCLQFKPEGEFCTAPYSTLINVEEGEETLQFCGIDQANISCGAVEALETGLTCPDQEDESCEAKGGICRALSTGFRCTYACSDGVECLSSGPASSCGNGGVSDGPLFCGG